MQLGPVSWVGMLYKKAGDDLGVMPESGNSVPLGSKRSLGKGGSILTLPHPRPSQLLRELELGASNLAQ